MNVQFQMLDVKVRLAAAILYKASVDSYSSEELTVTHWETNTDAHLDFWAKVAEFWQQNFSKFSDDKIMETYKIAKRNGFQFLVPTWKGGTKWASADASYVINSTKYFHSSGVYEYELKTAQDWKRNTKVARYALIIGGMFMGIQLPMDA